jgi:hypothetical protein
MSRAMCVLCDNTGIIPPSFDDPNGEQRRCPMCSIRANPATMQQQEDVEKETYDELLFRANRAEAKVVALRLRLQQVAELCKEYEKKIAYMVEADERAHGLAQWWADKCKEVEKQLAETNREHAKVRA